MTGKKKPVSGLSASSCTFDPAAGERFARLVPEERFALAIQQDEKIHPNYGSYVENGVSIAWCQMNHMLGCAAQWDEGLFDKWFNTWQTPVGNHYLIGDQVSYHPGWQEGAMAYGAQMRAIVATLPDDKAMTDVVAFINTLR